MNRFTIDFAPNRFTETLVFNGVLIQKRYQQTDSGWEGLDRSWEYENIPEWLMAAIEEQDYNSIMDALGMEEEEDE